MTAPFTAERWASEITHLLNAVMGGERFPVDIPMIAKEYSATRWPDDPIISVKGDNLPKFDGALFKAPIGKKGWGIIYNDGMTSLGRINFTLAPACCMEKKEAKKTPFPADDQATRTEFGHPRSSILLSAAAAIATSVARAWSLWKRSPSPMTCFQRANWPSTRALSL
jgi:hypothetical protein